MTDIEERIASRRNFIKRVIGGTAVASFMPGLALAAISDSELTENTSRLYDMYYPEDGGYLDVRSFDPSFVAVVEKEYRKNRIKDFVKRINTPVAISEELHSHESTRKYIDVTVYEAPLVGEGMAGFRVTLFYDGFRSRSANVVVNNDGKIIYCGECDSHSRRNYFTTDDYFVISDKETDVRVPITPETRKQVMNDHFFPFLNLARMVDEDLRTNGFRLVTYGEDAYNDKDDYTVEHKQWTPGYDKIVQVNSRSRELFCFESYRG